MLQMIGSWVLPSMVVLIVLFGFIKKVNVFDSFIEGARDGVKTVYKLMPSMVGLVLAVTMLKQSGGMELIAKLLSPAAKIFSMPPDILPIALLSPVSGGGSLSLFENVLKNFGPDSFEGRVASVLASSTETTFYAVTVYYSAIGIKNTRHTLYAGLMGDFTAFALCSLFVRLTIH